MTRIAHSNSIPISVEYLGLNEWAVRWDVQVDKDKETEDDIIHYKYNEHVFNHYPSYDEIKKIVDTGQFDNEQAQAINFIRTIINASSLTADKALEMKTLYPVWGKGDASYGTFVTKGFRFRVVTNNSDVLYEVIQDHTLQENWIPGVDTASLYKVVDKDHAGTLEDPIPYIPPMELFKDKYYTQNSKVYLCIRNSEMPLSHDLSSLVDNYVTLV